MYTFGANKFGQLGHGSDTLDNMPHKVMGLDDKSVQHLACGDTFTVAVTKGAIVARQHFKTDFNTVRYRM